MTSTLSKIPPVNQILENLTPFAEPMAPLYVKRIIEKNLNDVRRQAVQYRLKDLEREDILKLITGLVKKDITDLLTPAITSLINCSGIILHTGLGRAPFSDQDLEQLVARSGYLDLELDLEDGKRGERLNHVVPALKVLTEAEDAVVVNNNAAAVLLTLNSIARGKEVIVSRGELVEIGGSFRMPEVMKISQAKMVEVGTTNKTHLTDYEQAITARTAAILLVHPSNYQIVGFTAKPALKDILNLAHSRNLPVLFDLGSGALVDLRDFGYPYEPLVSEMIGMGFDIITFSGDKLLGGPQAGIILGRQELLKKIKKNHLLRALRCDKITLMLLSDCLQKYLRQPESLIQKNLTLDLLARKTEDLRTLARKIFEALNPDMQKKVKIVEAAGRVGSGAFPVFPLPALALQIDVKQPTAEKIADHFRRQAVPIIGYIENNLFHLNLLAVFPRDCPHIVSALNRLL